MPEEFCLKVLTRLIHSVIVGLRFEYTIMTMKRRVAVRGHVQRARFAESG